MPSPSQARIVNIISTKALPEPSPGYQRRVGAETLRQPRRIVGNDFFGVMGLIGNPLQNDAGKIELARRLLAGTEPNAKG